MPLEVFAFLILFMIALILFAFEWIPADVTALGLMLALILFGLIEPQAAFAGFGSETVLMILGLLILTETLIHTGLVDVVGRWLLEIVRNNTRWLQAMILIVASLLSAFISNTASTAFFLPIVLGLANRSGIRAAKLLMPLAFVTILAGSLTLIGTSTNLIVSGLMQQQGLAPIGMFELTIVGFPILIVGVLYVGTIGRRLTPDRLDSTNEPSNLDNALYFTEILIPSNSDLIGKTINESPLINEFRLGMLELHRQKQQIPPLANTILQAEDTLIVEATRADMLRLTEKPNIEISGKIAELDTYMDEDSAQVAEVVILPGSPLAGRSIKGLGLRERYQLQILAIYQGGGINYTKIGRRVLNIGDILLLKIPEQNLKNLEKERMFRILDIVETPPKNYSQIILASSIFIGSLSLAILGTLSIPVAVLLGAFLVFVTRCITPEEAYNRIQWRTIILIASMLAFGRAMQDTGTADYLANLIVQLPGIESPIWLLTLFFFLAMLLTQPMSNQAAAAVLVPIAIQTALLLNYDPRPFAIMIAIAASASFITPLEPACLLVYSAGRYKFMDFIRVGGFLTIIVYLIAIIIIPLVWEIG